MELSADRRVAAAVAGVLDAALAEGAFPGAIAVVGTRNRILAEHAVGRVDHAAGAPRTGPHTVWDLASLTKVVASTSAAMRLVEAGAIELDAPARRYLPGWTGAGNDATTVRHLLSHSGGLPAYARYYERLPIAGVASRDAVRAMVLATPLEYPPGSVTVYSDVGAILLGEIIEQVSGERLDAFVARTVFARLGMRDTRFSPADDDSAGAVELRSRAAPTEVDRWRGRQLRGEVHDENAWAMGGVAGHAGLFSTAADLSAFAQMLLGGGAHAGVRIFDPATVAAFTAPRDPSSRALGWDTATRAASAGRRLSAAAFGHTGFTGASLWIDPVSDVFVLLLSNRVNPTRDNDRIGAVRAGLADAVMLALGSPASADAEPAPLGTVGAPSPRATPRRR